MDIWIVENNGMPINRIELPCLPPIGYTVTFKDPNNKKKVKKYRIIDGYLNFISNEKPIFAVTVEELPEAR